VLVEAVLGDRDDLELHRLIGVALEQRLQRERGGRQATGLEEDLAQGEAFDDERLLVLVAQRVVALGQLVQLGVPVVQALVETGGGFVDPVVAFAAERQRDGRAVGHGDVTDRAVVVRTGELVATAIVLHHDVVVAVDEVDCLLVRAVVAGDEQDVRHVAGTQGGDPVHQERLVQLVLHGVAAGGCFSALGGGRVGPGLRHDVGREQHQDCEQHVHHALHDVPHGRFVAYIIAHY